MCRESNSLLILKIRLFDVSIDGPSYFVVEADAVMAAS